MGKIKVNLAMQKIKSFIKNSTTFIKNNKTEFLFLVGIILIGSFFRFYRIGEYMTFLGDEGRDALVVRRLLVNADIILVGPGTSIGNMYLGPLYYYFIAPALLLFNFSPIGPSILVAFFGVLTIFLVWYATRDMFGRVAAFAASILYAIAPTIIIYTKSSWNPNIMPFFALLTVYGIWRFWQNREVFWLPIVGLSFAFVMQSHYLGLLILPVVLIFWFLVFYKEIQNRKNSKEIFRILKFSLLGIFIFGFLMSPLVIFDARHDWRNFSAIEKFFTDRQTTVSIKPWSGFAKVIPQLDKITSRLVSAKNEYVGGWLVVGYLAALAWIFGLYRQKLTSKEKQAFIFLFIWLGIGVVGLSLYKQEIYDHYYGFLAPALFILLGGILGHVKKVKLLGNIFLLTILIFLIIVNLNENPIKYSPNRQLQRSADVANKIIEESNGQNFNFAVIAERNYEGAYQYFMEKNGSYLVQIDPQKADETIANQLFVVCELDKSKCDPTHNSKAEVANFGWSKIENEWDLYGVTIYKLVHSKK